MSVQFVVTLLELFTGGVPHVPPLVDDCIRPAELTQPGEDFGVGFKIRLVDGEAMSRKFSQGISAPAARRKASVRRASDCTKRSRRSSSLWSGATPIPRRAAPQMGLMATETPSGVCAKEEGKTEQDPNGWRPNVWWIRHWLRLPRKRQCSFKVFSCSLPSGRTGSCVPASCG